jgi:hypothetical protein
MRWSRVPVGTPALRSSALLSAALRPSALLSAALRLAALLSTALVSTALLSPVPAFAAGPSGPVAARCAFSYSPAISPGVGLLTDSGTVSSGGETGTVDCSGDLDGREITGTGTWGFEGRLSEANCVEGGKGSGRILMTVPTAAGLTHFEEFITFAFGPVGAYPPLVGDWVGDRTSGVFVVAPAEGDCVTAKVTRVDASGQMSLHRPYPQPAL